ncbi:type II toxin-antitoxin system PemK/MazF family toxin [Chlamydiota bacterium]
MEIKRGSLYWVSLDPTRGSEIKKRRPCVVIGANPINRARRTVVIIPLSSIGKERYPLAIGVSCMNQKAIAVVDQIRAIDKSRITAECGRLSSEEMETLEKALRLVLEV